MREQVKAVLAKMLLIDPEAIKDETDISSLNPAELQLQILLVLEFCLGGASGHPKTFGELMKMLDEMKQMIDGPKVVIRL